MGQMERVALKYIHYQVKNGKASGNLLGDAGSSNLVLCDNLDRRGRVEEGGGSGTEDTCIPMTDSC